MGESSSGPRSRGDGRYEADITWTEHGVPHITAGDWGSLGFGQGWACARDNAAAIADHVMKVASQRCRYLGRGDGDAHLHSDLGYLALGVDARARRMAAAQPPVITDVVDGYAAGYNAWLAEHGPEAFPAWCQGAPWIRPVTAHDLMRLYVDLAIMGSGRNLVPYIGSAVAPGGPVEEPVPPAPPEPLAGEEGLASNGWAFGRAATANGRGLVMANPHFPWWGEGRFWECHLRLPGTLDVYGASLVGAPLVQIGFNRHVAWTHTFSCGNRFTVFQLPLVDGSPTTYRYGDTERDMVPTRYAVEVADRPWVPGDPTGAGRSPAAVPTDLPTSTVERELWSSHQGPMLNLPLVGWSEAVGFTYRDANLDNDRFLAQTLAMNTAAGVGDLQAAIEEHQGLPWVNTIAADAAGRCWYIDASTTPNLSEGASKRFLDRLDTDLFTQIAYGMRVVLLDGSDPDDEWIDDPTAPQPGILPYSALPQLERDDHVFNANDPYWLVNAHEEVPEHSPLCGLHHRPVSLRTRMNALLVSGRGPVGPTAEGGRWTADDAVAAVFGNHSVVAELLGDEIIERLGRAGTVEVDGRTVDVAPAAALLAAWDRRFEVGSVGAVVWRELMGSLDEAERGNTTAPGAGPLWDRPFDGADPLRTPSGLAPAPADGPDPLVMALARGLLALEVAGVAPDAVLGDVQFADRRGRRWPVHGGDECDGVANILASRGHMPRGDLDPNPVMAPDIPVRTERTGLRAGGYPAAYGASFVMVVSFAEDGPEGAGLLAYGQSADPDSPHHDDQLEAFGAKRLRPFLLTDEAIAADPTAVRRHLSA
jgi:acyl-homoserine-lactone acylase